MKPLLFIFAKAPLMGQAKTRLAADIGLVHAQREYRAMCAKVFRECTGPSWDTVLYATPEKKLEHGFGGLWPKSLPRISQADGDLTARLARAFSVKRTIICIGTDAPQIKKRDISEAIQALKKNDAVFGPADDGGFWLIGLNGPADERIFANVRWSHAETFADIQKNIKGSLYRLRTLSDVDDGAALAQYKRARLGC